MSDLTSITGVVALVALAVAIASLGLTALLLSKLRRLRSAQAVVLGGGEARDLIELGSELQQRVDELDDRHRRLAASADDRFAAAERRLGRSLSRTSVVRYDAYGEMSGRQSSSIVILDEHADGVLVSSILHREQARVYAKQVRAGDSELGISPEEREAIDAAMARTAAADDPSDAPDAA